MAGKFLAGHSVSATGFVPFAKGMRIVRSPLQPLPRKPAFLPGGILQERSRAK
jgi:hypothetical protein